MGNSPGPLLEEGDDIEMHILEILQNHRAVRKRSRWEHRRWCTHKVRHLLIWDV